MPTPSRAVAAATTILAALVCLLGVSGPATADPPRVASPRAARHASHAPRVFSGRAFDTCNAPSLSALRSWRRSSPYGAVGVYVGGRNRACEQSRLNAGWVRAAAGIGWRLLPLYVGDQAPCLSRSFGSSRINSRHASASGTSDGHDAVRSAAGLGIAPGSPIYLDMEAYPRGSGRCTQAVLQYTSAWTHALHAAGYLSGFYSSADAGVADLSAAVQHHSAAIRAGVPDVIWYARWDDRDSTDGRHALHGGLWQGHRRVHQFRGNWEERHGGVTIRIDRSAVDAPVAVVR